MRLALALIHFDELAHVFLGVVETLRLERQQAQRVEQVGVVGRCPVEPFELDAGFLVGLDVDQQPRIGQAQILIFGIRRDRSLQAIDRLGRPPELEQHLGPGRVHAFDFAEREAAIEIVERFLRATVLRRQHRVQVLRVGALGMLVGEPPADREHGVGVLLAREDTEQRREQFGIVEFAVVDQTVDILEGLLDLVLADVDRGDYLARLDAVGLELDPAVRGLDCGLEILAVDRDAHRALSNRRVALPERDAQIVLDRERDLPLVERDLGDHQVVGRIRQRVLRRRTAVDR